jgi:DNA primase large subunit
MKIIQSNQPSTGDHHGCPFRHFSAQSLEATLYKNKVGASQVNEIVRLAKDRHYQLACTRYFEVTHPDIQSGQIGTVEHPNQYFDMSQGKIPNRDVMATD